MNLFIDIFVAFVDSIKDGSDHMLIAYVEVHARVAYGSSHFPVCDPIHLLRYVPHQTRHTRLGPYHKSG